MTANNDLAEAKQIADEALDAAHRAACAVRDLMEVGAKFETAAKAIQAVLQQAFPKYEVRVRHPIGDGYCLDLGRTQCNLEKGADDPQELPWPALEVLVVAEPKVYRTQYSSAPSRDEVLVHLGYDTNEWFWQSWVEPYVWDGVDANAFAKKLVELSKETGFLLDGICGDDGA